MFCFPFRGVFFAPRAMSSRSGCASSAALRPAFACDRAVPLAARTLVVRPSAAHVSTRRSARSGPARSGAMAPIARGADFSTTLSFATGLVGRSRRSGSAAGQVRPTALREGGSQSARRVPAAIPPKAAGTRRADRGWGIGDPAKRETPRGPGPRRAAGSQPEESRRAASGGEQAPSGRAPAGQDKSRYGTRKKEPTPMPAGQGKTVTQ